MESRKKSIVPRVVLKVEELENRLTPALIPPALSSLPGARAAIYLNFTGDQFQSGTFQAKISAFQGATTTFTPAQMTLMREIWNYVKEDYLAFNINVTTVKPPPTVRFVTIDIGRTAGTASLVYGSEFFIAPGLNSFSTGIARGAISSNILTSTSQLGNLASAFAAVSLGARYQYQFPPGSPALPNPGFPSQLFPDGVVPILGNVVLVTNPAGSLNPQLAPFYLYQAPFFFAISLNNFGDGRGLWWFGPNSQNLIQNDMNTIANNFLVGYKRDDFGSTFQAAQFLNITSRSANNFRVNGLIGAPGDVDFFKFDARIGPIDLTVSVPAPYNNLNPFVQLIAQDGVTVLQTGTAGANFSSTINFNARYNGTYYLRVAGYTNPSSPNATSLNRSIDQGSYSVTGTILPYITSLRVSPPLRWTYNPVTGTYSGYISIVSTQSLPGAFSLQFGLPSSTMRVIGANVTQSGNIFQMNFSSGLVANQPILAFIAISNPLNFSLGTYYTSFLRNYLYL